MPQKYVLVYVRNQRDEEGRQRFLLVRKNRPPEQAGRLNLVGGKVEPGELPLLAAVREFKEETGLVAFRPVLYGHVTGGWGIIYCYSVEVHEDDLTVNPRDGEDEHVFWSSWDEVKYDDRLMTNLNVMIPLFMSSTAGWVVSEQHLGDAVGVLVVPDNNVCVDKAGFPMIEEADLA